MVGRGYAKTDQYPKRNSSFFVIKIQEHFEFHPDWYWKDTVRGLILEYYFILRSALKTKSHLRSYLTRCKHCRIFFLTDPRNPARRDLGCPFGCKVSHRKQCSTERSVAYNRTDSGKRKKKQQNGKRGKPRPVDGNGKSDRQNLALFDQRQSGSGQTGTVTGSVPLDLGPCPALDKSTFNAGMVEYVRVVTSLIESRRVSRDEVLQMLKRTVRQHSLARERRVDYLMRALREKPP